MLKHILVLLITFVPLLGQIKPTVELVGGAEPQFCTRLAAVLSEVLLESNRVFKNAGDLESVKGHFTSEGYTDFSDIVVDTQPYTARTKYKLNVIQIVGRGLYEVRGVKMNVNIGETEVSPLQYMVFTFNTTGKIIGIRYSLPSFNYDEILDSGEDLADKARRQRIIEFLEVFGTAYNRKDAAYLENIFSDDALIITGFVTYRKPEFNDLATNINQPLIKVVEYRQSTKKQYIKKLREFVFPSNSYIDLKFNDIKVMKHRKMENVYGIKLKQHWKAERYEDEGYLFLTIYFRKDSDPLILVRVWQDQDFEDDYDVSIYDFDIIE